MSIEDRLGCPIASLPAVLLKDHALALLTIGTFAGARRIADLTGAMKVSVVAGVAWRLFINLSSPSCRTTCREGYRKTAKTDWKHCVGEATLVGFFGGYLALRFFPFDFEVISRITTRTIGLICGYSLSGLLLPAMIVWNDPKADQEAHSKWVREQEEINQQLSMRVAPEPHHTISVLQLAQQELGTEFKNELGHVANFHRLVDRLAIKLGKDLGNSDQGLDTRMQAVKELPECEDKSARALVALILEFHHIWVFKP